MLHIRVIAPQDLSAEVVNLITQTPVTANVVVLAGAAHAPAGDLIEFDVAREATSEMLRSLRALDLENCGSITVEQLDLSISASSQRAEEAAPGDSSDAVIWDELADRTANDAKPTWAFLIFLALATQIAAIGTLLDQPILIVGAMVLGPEFGAVAAICFGLVWREPRRIGIALTTLAIGFSTAIVITLICATISRALGWIYPSMLDDRPLTHFIIAPDKWSFIIALLAGIAGILSITAGKSSALVGVFISVTTVPAAGNIAVAIALAHWSEVGSSGIQLGVNLLGMVLSGTLALLIQRALWKRFGIKIRQPLRRQKART